MKSFSIASIVLLLSTAACLAQEMPEMPKPQKEHAWLEQFAGEWDTETEIKAPDQPVMNVKGEDSSRMVGGFWLVTENKGKMMDTPFTGIMTLGYDPKSKKYVGTWVDSMSDTLWNYNGTAEGNKLTLDAKGPCPMRPGEIVNFKETLEIKDDGKKVFTSSIQEKDGSWTKMITATSTRKKK